MTLADEIHKTFLFEHLTDEQIGELAAAGSVECVEAGETLFHEGEPADFLWVLLDGALELSRHMGGQKVILMTTERTGIWAGGMRAYGEGTPGAYRATIRAVRTSRMFRLPSAELGRLLWTWFPMGKHLLDGLFQTVESIESMVRQRESEVYQRELEVRQRESLVALGTMAAGLAHELNNPGAAAARASDELRSTLEAMREGLQDLAGGGLSPEQLQSIFALQAQVMDAAPDAPPLDPLGAADREDEMADWLQSRGLDDGWRVAPTLMAAGLDLDWLEHAEQSLGSHALAPGLRWISCSVTASSLLAQIDDATRRISALVGAVKEHTGMDRAPIQEIDVHKGLESTLVVLGHKLKDGVDVARDYDPALPRIEAYGGELNQVWLNLVDNAVDAMGGTGQVRLRTSRDGDGVLVEIADNGPGMSQDIQRRIFEPFFTTKEPGKGTGLGLDIARRIVVERHGGELSVESEPGDTRFMVRLPLRLKNSEP